MKSHHGLAKALTPLMIVLTPLSLFAVETANITVGPLGGGPTVTINNGSANFFVDPGAVDGEFPIRIGPSAADDFASGILMASTSEDGRLVSGERIFATANVVLDDSSQSVANRNLSGGWAVSTRRAGIGPIGTPVLGGELMNMNFGAAYFPASQGWVGGTFSSSSVSGTGDNVAYGAIDQFQGFNGASLSDVDVEAIDIGYNVVRVPGVTDSRRQGLLFSTAADNVGRYSMSYPLSDGSGYAISTIDNDHFFTGDPDEANEDDGRLTPASYVFIPKDTPGVTMASIHGATVSDSVNPMVVTPTPLQATGNFSIVREDVGQFRLSIPGQTPSSGTLLLNSGGTGGGTGGRASDNVVSYQADGNDWIIRSQDPESNSAYAGTFDTPLDGTRGQDNSNPETYFQFAFIPHDGSVAGPGQVPDVSTLTTMSSRRIISWRAEVVDYNGGNGIDGMSHEVVDGTSNVNIQGLYDNRGDVGVAVDGAFLSTAEGVLFANVREGFRDNSAAGGLLEYGVIGVSDDFAGPDWKIHTAIADPANGEHNINYSAVYFGADSDFGFGLGQELQTASGALNVAIPGVGSTDEGALFVTPHGNDDNFAIATPNGSSWDVLLRDNGVGTGENDQINHVYLPYDADNLVAGQINPDGSVAAGTAGFTLSLEMIDLPGDFDPTARPAYRLTIPGKSPDDGVLMLTATGDIALEDNTDNSVVYIDDPDPAHPDSFLILGLDHRDGTADPNPFVIPEETGFYFAFIDYDNPPTLGPMCDFDGNGLCDAGDIDLLVMEVAGGSSDLSFDLNGDGAVDRADIQQWLADAGARPENAAATGGNPFLEGDSNLDGAVDGSDFILWNGSKFTATGKWTLGDWNADGATDGSDFIIWNGNKFTSSDVSSVPEPTSGLMAMLGVLAAGWLRRRR